MDDRLIVALDVPNALAGLELARQLGDEGAELRLMPVAEFVVHPRAVPHFRGIVAEITRLGPDGRGTGAAGG